MAEGKTCGKCEKSGGFAKNVLCKKTEQFTCRDCCVKTNGGLGSCHDWKFCWPTFYDI